MTSLWTRLVVVPMVVGGLCGACDSSDDSGSGADFDVAPATVPGGAPTGSLPPLAPPAPDVVVYDLAGSASSVQVTLANESGGTEQFVTPLPYHRELTPPPNGFVYISAQNQDAGGDVSCAIRHGPFPIQQASSSGAYVIATCSGSVSP